MRRLFVLLIIISSGCGNAREAAELYREGMKEFGARRLASAEKYFLGAMEKDGSLLNAPLMLCKICYYNENYKSAVEYADLILRKDPDHAVAMYWKARSLIMTKQDEVDEPANLLVRSLEIDSHNIEARLLLGMIYERNSQYKEALHQYLAVLEEEEGILSARGNLALLYRRMGLGDKSERELSVAARIAELTGRGGERLKLIRGEMEGTK